MSDKPEGRRVAVPIPRYLFTVESLFTIAFRGVVAEPGVNVGDPLRSGDMIELRRPDKTVARTTVGAIMYAPSIVWVDERPTVVRCGVLFGPELTAADVPIGTEVWAVGLRPFKPSITAIFVVEAGTADRAMPGMRRGFGWPSVERPTLAA